MSNHQTPRATNSECCQSRRVLMFNKYYPPHLGGIESHIHSLATQLVAKNLARVEVVCCSQAARTTQAEKTWADLNPEIPVHRASRLFERASTPVSLQLAPLLQKQAVAANIVHAHHPYPFGDLAWLQAMKQLPPQKRPPLIVTYHSDIVRQKRLEHLYGPLRKTFLDQASAIIVSSPQIKDASPVLAEYRSKVEVIPFGCDTLFFSATDKPSRQQRARELREGIDAIEGPLTLFVGRLVYYKGVEILLEAFKQVPGQLVLIGTGPLRTALHQRAMDSKLVDRVTFIDSVSDEELASWYEAADVLCLPSIEKSEAFGLVQIEAHAAGTPTVTSALPTGVSFATLNGEDGLTVQPGKPQELADALKKILGSDGLRERLGQQARLRARELFDIRDMANSTCHLYDRICSP